ncbi:cell division protein FtsL [Microbacterium sp. SORGH_AS 862]|nr:cell division protein FtsL [Microbacterium sp. SORGH_AS_0862]
MFCRTDAARSSCSRDSSCGAVLTMDDRTLILLVALVITAGALVTFILQLIRFLRRERDDRERDDREPRDD